MDLFKSIAEAEAKKREEEQQAVVSLPEPTPEQTAAAEAALKRLAQIAAAAQSRNYESKLQSNLVRRRIMSALWLLGTSYRQLSVLYGITVQTIRNAVVKEIGMSAKRLHTPTTHTDRLSFEAVSWYYEKLNARPDVPGSMNPTQVVNWLLANHPFQGD